eukprot:2104244-Pleurochrysis_carterae.AAC.2
MIRTQCEGQGARGAPPAQSPASCAQACRNGGAREGRSDRSGQSRREVTSRSPPSAVTELGELEQVLFRLEAALEVGHEHELVPLRGLSRKSAEVYEVKVCKLEGQELGQLISVKSTQRRTTSCAWRTSGFRLQESGRRRPPRPKSSSFGSIFLVSSIATPLCAPSCVPTTSTLTPFLT